MADDVVQCSRCGQDTPADSLYCERCGAYLGGGAHAASAQAGSAPRRGWPVFDMPLDLGGEPVRDELAESSDFLREAASDHDALGMLERDTLGVPDHDALGMPEYASETAAFNTSEGDFASAQLIAPPQFADVIVRDEFRFGFGGGGGAAAESDQSYDWEEFEEPAGSMVAGAPFEDWDSYTGPATRGELPSSLAFIRQGEDEYPPVDPVSAPYQPRLGIFRVIIVIVIAVLFGAAIVLLSCLAVMRLLGF